MGFIEETGAAQLYRDARIAQIYEGTNGIQAIDLVTRKLPLSGGAAVRAYLAELWRHRGGGRSQQRSGVRRDRHGLARGRRCVRQNHRMAARAHRARAADRARGRHTLPAPVCARRRRLPAGAGRARRKARRQSRDSATATARFFATNLATAAPGLATTVIEGADALAVDPDAIG